MTEMRKIHRITDEAKRLAGERRRRCRICGALTYDWEIVNGGPVQCWPCGKRIREADELYRKS